MPNSTVEEKMDRAVVPSIDDRGVVVMSDCECAHISHFTVMAVSRRSILAAIWSIVYGLCSVVRSRSRMEVFASRLHPELRRPAHKANLLTRPSAACRGRSAL